MTLTLSLSLTIIDIVNNLRFGKPNATYPNTADIAPHFQGKKHAENIISQKHLIKAKKNCLKSF